MASRGHEERTVLKGEALAPGTATGKAHLIRQINLEALERNPLPVQDADAEVLRLDAAVARSVAQLQHVLGRISAETHPQIREIIEAQVVLLQDITLLDKVKVAVQSRRVNAEHLLANEIRLLRATFQSLQDEMIKSRFLDIQDAQHRLLRNLLDIEHVRANPLSRLDEPVIVVADRLLPSDIALLEFHQIRGLIIEECSALSHVAIIAKSLGIPALTRATGATAAVRAGDIVFLDADAGTACVRPKPADARRWEAARQRERTAAAAAPASTARGCRTLDGVEVTLEGNAGSLREVHDALANGAEGIGLLRSEFFYMSQLRLPSPAAEIAFYRAVLSETADRPVTIRLLDLGADKCPPYLALPAEANPQLGVRGMRLLRRHAELFRRHLQSVVEACALGPVRLLLPFVSTLADLESALSSIRTVSAESQLSGRHIPTGIMVEVPAAALCIESFLEQIDFLSIGTNDLVQYVFAADREDGELGEYRQNLHPAVLRLIADVVAAAARHGKPVSICGEMAGDPTAASLLVGLGVRSLSMQADRLPHVRSALTSCLCSDLEATAARVLQCESLDAVNRLLVKTNTRRQDP